MADMPDLDRLREAQGKPIWPRYPSEGERRWLMAHVDALDFLLSLADSGGRLVVEQPCEHGALDAHVWFTPKNRLARECPGGSRRQVWPTDKEEA
jgi:hypothetical protein